MIARMGIRRSNKLGTVRFYRRLSGEDHLFPSTRPDVNEKMWPTKKKRLPPAYDSSVRKKVKRLDREDFKPMIISSKRSVTSESFVLKTRRDPSGDDLKLPRSSVMVEKSILKRAVDRNLCKRRLREAARHVFPTYASRDKKYFIIGRSQAVVTDFVSLQWEFVDALRSVNCLSREPADVESQNAVRQNE